MCGISGFVQCAGQASEAALTDAARKMISVIVHRGPDDGGVWMDPDAGVGLGHRRLAIIDLSEKGKQPMVSSCGRYVIAYNGEIYNFGAIRNELEKAGIVVEGGSDTAVLLAAIAHWGVGRALEQAHGMFAFGVWDRLERKLVLARDRLGEKPLYYGYSGDCLLFGSELKSLRAHPQWKGAIDRDVVTLQLRHGYIPAPHSIYQGIYKLLPGSILELSLNDLRRRKALNPAAQSGRADAATPQRYWELRTIAEAAAEHKDGPNMEEAVDGLQELLSKTISNQMIADVPLGAFLSGGIDSSTVVALMQAQSSRPVRTFTIGFHEDRFNEARYARKIAQHLGTDHTELYLSSREAMGVIPDLPVYYDEPFSDPSQIPTCLVSRLAKQDVTVALSGDGGDELFAGYDRYFWATRIWNAISRFPRAGRKALAGILHGMPPQTWDRVITSLYPVISRRYQVRQPGEKLNKLGDLLQKDEFEAMYNRLVSYFSSPAQYVIGASEPVTVQTNRADWPGLSDRIESMQYLDMMSYLPDDILVKLDRASMRVSLECRVPLLDHKIVEYAWSLPAEHKVQRNTGKHVLKNLLYRYIPRELIDRPKMGFGVPVGEWLRGGLREWAEDLLDESGLDREGILNAKRVRQRWIEHISGKRNWEYQLWNILMFQAWYRQGRRSKTSLAA